MKDPFKKHIQDGSHWTYFTPEQQEELIELFEYFGYGTILDIPFREYEYENSDYNSYVIWLDGVAVDVYDVFDKDSFEMDYTGYYREMVRELKKRFEYESKTRVE